MRVKGTHSTLYHTVSHSQGSRRGRVRLWHLVICRDEMRLSELHRNECWLALLEREDTREGTRGILGPAGGAQKNLAFLFSVLSSIVTIKKQGQEGRKEGKEEGGRDRRKKKRRRKEGRHIAAFLAGPCLCSAPRVQPAAQSLLLSWRGAFFLGTRVLGPACLPASGPASSSCAGSHQC